MSAEEIASGVREGRIDPVEQLQEALDRYHEKEPEINAFRVLRREKVLAEARALKLNPELSKLPLAGVPIAIKDAIAVAGETLKNGSLATDDSPQEADHQVVKRLRDAGALILGLTNVPEMCVWASTDSSFGITRNPWNVAHTPGGSSGGSAAAVAAGVVPIAHGTDGMGSIRIPAANCGIFGIKPGSGTVPQDFSEWFGMSENGVLSATVDDAALMLSVMAEKPELANPGFPEMPLRIALSFKPPTILARLDPEWKSALLNIAAALRAAGHRVDEVEFPYQDNTIALLARWTGGVAEATKDLKASKLEKRTRMHATVGRRMLRWGLKKDSQYDSQLKLAEGFFNDYDLLITPTLTKIAPEAAAWYKRGWIRNLLSNIRYASYPSIWNMLGWPAASIPAGVHPELDMPLSAQIVAPPGQEKLILQLAKVIGEKLPWPLTAI
ncbi:MAG: amidase [Microbacteriaceae bacterium]